MNDKTLNIKLKRSNCKVMSTWEIQDFIGKLINNYYKIDILNEISKEINNGTKLENIVILDKSFDFKVTYSYLGDTDIIDLVSEKGAKNFYHIGSPIGYFPSKNILELNIKLNIFRTINIFLHNKKIDRLNKNEINHIILLNIDEAIQFMQEKSQSIISKSFKENDTRKVYFRELQKIIDEENRKLKLYNKNEKDIEWLKRKIADENIENVEGNERIYENYFTEFTKLLVKLDRPIIGVLSDDNKSIKILCKSYIHKKTRDARFLDLKNFSHNSPTFVEICAGVAFAVPLIPLIKVTKDSLKNKINEGKLIDQENKIKNKLDNIETKLLNLKNQEGLDSCKKIEIKIVNESLNNVNDELVNRMNSNLSNYNFDNYNIEVNVINFEQERRRRKLHKKGE